MRIQQRLSHLARRAMVAKNSTDGHWTTVEDGTLNNEFHTYGVEITPKRTTIYLDRKSIWSFDTPKEFHMPFYPLVNLALGSGWPIDETPNPSYLAGRLHSRLQAKGSQISTTDLALAEVADVVLVATTRQRATVLRAIVAASAFVSRLPLQS